MPNRIIKESICTSDTIDALSLEEERMFYRLMVNCDDFGILHGDPRIIRSKCFPLKEGVTSADVDGWIQGLVKANLAFLYSVDGKAYIKITKWEEHQQVRAKNSKYPTPDMADQVSLDINCNQASADSLVFENRESNNEKRENNVGDSAESHDDDKPAAWTDADEQLANEMLDRVRDVAPSSKGSKKWADCIRLMRERDGRTHAEILDMFTWANNDSFWRQNILSPAKLREKWPQLEAKRNSASARASPGHGRTKQDLRADFWEQMKNGRDSETERVITGKAERVG